jgi:hypothetical protein
MWLTHLQRMLLLVRIQYSTCLTVNLNVRHWLYYVLTHFVSLRTALAAVALLRSLAGFGFPLFAPAMYSALGYGKGVTILAIAYCCGMAGVRVNRRVQLPV